MQKGEHAPRRVVATGADAINSVRRVRDLVRHAVSRLDQSGVGFGHAPGNDITREMDVFASQVRRFDRTIAITARYRY